MAMGFTFLWQGQEQCLYWLKVKSEMNMFWNWHVILDGAPYQTSKFTKGDNYLLYV